MNIPRLSAVLVLSLTLTLSRSPASEPLPPAAGAAVSLFDGKSLTGWEGNPEIWRVEDGVITGGSLAKTVTRNEFLATTKEYGNFIVRFQIKLTGSEGFINSGFQIRSQRVPDDSEMAGYQCDYGDPSWWGCIYDESRRNKLMAQSDMKTLEPVLRRNDWNDYVIRADGPRITTWINGVMGVDYTEADPAIIQTGRMGIQVHGGGKALVQVRKLRVEELPATPRREGAREPEKSARESPLPADGEAATFSLAPGLEMELVVEEDLEEGFGKFVAVQFDQRGRLWTMTAREYPVDANENPAAADALYAGKGQDRILIYDILNRGQEGGGTAYAREPSVFADGLAIPLGILPFKDGCYTQHGHEIVRLRDTDGDGKSDRREVVLTGFGVQDSHLFPHQFTRAPGGWIWMAQGAFNYGKVAGPDGKVTPFDQTRMAKFRPDGSDFTITSNGPCNIWGLVLNGEGESFIQEANDFGYPVMPFQEYANYPGCSNAQWKSYAPEFPGTADFRMGGTGLSGLALTDADGAFPPDWSDVMLVANPITNRIQAIKMHRDGAGWRLEKLPDAVAAGDEWFRPVGMTLGPDGAVYIVDWYNKIISHNEVPRNHPDRDKKRGRIWRLKGKEQKGFAVRDFTKIPEAELVAKLGGTSLAQSHLAWQALEDRGTLAPETITALKSKITQAASIPVSAEQPYPDAARIQALWVLVQLGMDPVSSIEPLMKSPNRNVRREAAASGIFPAMELLSDPDPEVRAVSLSTLGTALGAVSGEGEQAAGALLHRLLAAAGPPLTEPRRPSSHSGKPILGGPAYAREFERYLVRMFLEDHPEQTAAFLDSNASAGLPAENLMIACLSLPAKESAPRVAALLAKLDRAPGEEEILRLAESPEHPAVRQALAALVSSADGLEALLRQKARFDARALAPQLTETARGLLGTNRPLALRLISAFQLTELEPLVAAIPADPEVLAVLARLGSVRPELFLPLTTSSDPVVRDAALAALVTSPGRLLPLWTGLNTAQRRLALEGLAARPEGASALVAAVQDSRIAREELDAPLVEKLQAVLKEDAALKALLDSMSGLFAEVLDFDGADGSYVDRDVTLEGAFTVEAWVKLGPKIGNRDSLLGAPDQLDMNFYDSRFRVWVGGGAHDIAVSKKPVTPDIWTHVAVTRDADGQFRLYQNGEPDAEGTATDRRMWTNLKIGRSNVPQGTRGQFTEFRIWNACRTADEIRTAFDRTGLAGSGFASDVSTPASPAVPVFYRPLNAPWPSAKKGARVARTMDFPALITPDAARELDKKFAHYRALAEKPGDAAKGQVLGAVCTACHQVGGAGGQIGPNLSSAGAMGVESLLRNILTPNAAMEPGYRVYRVELTDGSIREGFLAGQDETALILRVPGSEDERIPRDRTGHSGYTRRSLMPDGLELTFTPEQWTDLFAWLKSLK